MLKLRRKINGPVDLIFPGSEPNETSNYEEYVSDLVKNKKSAHDLAREKMSTQAIA